MMLVTAGLECVHVYFASLMVLNCAVRIRITLCSSTHPGQACSTGSVTTVQRFSQAPLETFLCPTFSWNKLKWLIATFSVWV